jgi:alcohol dehydrogenase class IV
MEVSEVFAFHLPEEIRFGPGVYRQLPEILRLRGLHRVAVISDMGVVAAGIAGQVVATLKEAAITYEVYDRVRAEPHLADAEECRHFVQNQGFAAVVGVGGGSVLDTA